MYIDYKHGIKTNPLHFNIKLNMQVLNTVLYIHFLQYLQGEFV